jgi:hypothetical protein
MKTPWTPAACGWLAFVFGAFGPIPGAFISFINLRRMKKSASAWRVLFLGPVLVALTLFLIAVVGVYLLHWDMNRATAYYLGWFIGMCANAFVYRGWQENAFEEWKNTHPGDQPNRWWTAIPWTVLAILLQTPFMIVIARLVSKSKLMNS